MIRSRIWFIGVLCLCLLSLTVQAQTPTPTPSTTPEPVRELRVWLPDVVFDPGNDSLRDLLDQQTAAFVAEENNVTVDMRLKQVGTTGGIMSTLRSAQDIVSQDALPTLTLIRRQDLTIAQRLGLIQSLQGELPTRIESDLDTALQLGLVKTEAQPDGDLYGIPYLLQLQHFVYRSDQSIDDWTYNALLERNQSFIFPAGRTNSLNNTFLLQYLAAGGSLTDEGSLTLNQAALQETLEFYETASDAGIVDGFALNYASPTDYITDFREGEFDVAMFNSSHYLELREAEDNLHIAPIPTITGRPATTLDGWMWVIITADSEQQALALRYVTWLMDVERQATLARAAHFIPSQASALPITLNDEEDTRQYRELLNNPILPITESDGGTLARTMQDALSSVLTKESTAAQATQRVISQQAE